MKISFKSGLKIYACVLLGIIVITCIVLWIALANYQKDYDTCKENGSPAKYAEQFTKTTDVKAMAEYLDNAGYGKNYTAGTSTQHARYLADLAQQGQLSFKENEKFASALPIYDIYNQDKKIAVISLKPFGKNDNFGFHQWQLKELLFDESAVEMHSITIKIPEDGVVTYEGNVLDKEAFEAEGAAKDVVTQKAVSLGAKLGKVMKLKVENVIGEPQVFVTNASGDLINAYVKNNTYDYSILDASSLEQSVTPRIYEIMEAYIMNIYRKKAFSEMSKYLEYGSDAYKVVADVQASTAWGWIPERVTVLEQKATDFVKYNDNLFACNYYGKIDKFKQGSMENGEETFNYRAIFRKVNGIWYLNYFVMD